MRCALSIGLITALWCCAPPALATPEDLAKVYPGRLGWVQHGLNWTCSPADVWRLKSFEFEHKKQLAIETGPATVAFGVHDGNALWAVVFPDNPAEIETDLPGGGDHARSILLRFAPAAVGEVFPKRTVKGNGDAWRRAEADRIFRHKIGWKWSTPAGNPTIVQPGWFIVDIDTVEGPRRFYGVDRNANVLEYVDTFTSKPVPETTPIEAQAARAAFDEVWSAFDTEYPKFGLVKDVDWRALGEQYGDLADQAGTTFGLAAVIADMLAHLRDLHVSVKAGDDWLPGYTRDRPLNASWKGTQAQLSQNVDAGPGLAWGRTEDGIGYVNVHALSDASLPDRFDEALDALGDSWGLVVDLRFNGGGDEGLAKQLAGRFLDTERLYSKNQYRSGPDHEDLGEVLDRTAGPRGPWRYESPVVVLWGQRTLSSAESFALMLAQCPQVTSMGDRTGGSSANPRKLELDCGITVNLPRWLDMAPDGEPIEHRGVLPDKVVEADPGDFTDTGDPVFEATLKELRKTSKRRREPGRR